MTLVLLTALTVAAEAQTPDSLQAVELALAQHLRQELAHHTSIAVDPARARVGAAAVERSEHANAAVASAIGGQVQPLSSVLSCPNGPRTCRLTVSTHVTLGRIMIVGDTATVETMRRWTTGRPQNPVAYSRREYQLERTSSGWRVIGSIQKTSS